MGEQDIMDIMVTMVMVVTMVSTMLNTMHIIPQTLHMHMHLSMLLHSLTMLLHTTQQHITPPPRAPFRGQRPLPVSHRHVPRRRPAPFFKAGPHRGQKPNPFLAPGNPRPERSTFL